jgi:transcriptional regulator of aromatic amino acid metabolism
MQSRQHLCASASDNLCWPISTRVVSRLSGRGACGILNARESCRECNRPFIKLNCAAIPLGILESELFGHEKGAFTGAVTQKLGRFEAANGGSLFLDEIGDIPLELQAKLLRVLQEQEFERLGSTYTRGVDARIVAATNQELAEPSARSQCGIWGISCCSRTPITRWAQ